MSDDEDDGWELLVGPAHYQTNSEKNLHEFCNAAKNGDLEKVYEHLYSYCCHNIVKILKHIEIPLQFFGHNILKAF